MVLFHFQSIADVDTGLTPMYRYAGFCQSLETCLTLAHLLYVSFGVSVFLCV